MSSVIMAICTLVNLTYHEVMCKKGNLGFFHPIIFSYWYLKDAHICNKQKIIRIIEMLDMGDVWMQTKGRTDLIGA